MFHIDAPARERRKTLAATLLLLAAVALPTQAQDLFLEELTVTAQKQEESLLSVPLSIDLISVDELLELNILSFDELAEITPGVEFNAGLQSAAIRVRGIGPGAFSLNAPQSVAIFVDEFAQSQLGAAFSTLFDTQRVEVLRGPQGTLYGQNAPAGVYNITTRAPNLQDATGYLQSSISSHDWDADRTTLDTRGAVSLPLIKDTLAWRIAGLYREADGFATAENPNANFDAIGGGNSKALRSRLLWQPNNRSQVAWTVNVQDVKRNPIGSNIEGQVPGTGGNNPTPAEFSRFKERKYWGSFQNEVIGDIRDASLHLEHRVNGVKFDVLAFHQTFDTEGIEDRQPFSEQISGLDLDFDFELTTLELRASSSTEIFDYVVGLYYYDRPTDADVELTLGPTGISGKGAEGSETWSAFGNVDFALTADWSLALGLRYDQNTLTVDYASTLAGSEPVPLIDQSSYDHLSWSTKLRWQLDEDTMIYAALDNAFKQGGYNPLLATATGDTEGFPIVAEIASDNLRYDEEVTTAAELGIKGSALNGSLRYTAAAFYQLIDDYQISRSANGPTLAPFEEAFTNTITNAEEVRSQGVELRATYAFRTRWRLNVRAAYFDADILQWNQRLCVSSEGTSALQVYCPTNDQPLSNAPKWSTNTQLAYRRPLAGWQLYSRLGWTWISKVDEVRFTDEFRDQKNRLHASIGLRDRGRGLDARIWVKNLTNEDFNQNPGSRNNGDPSQPAAFRGSYSRGREFGLTVGYRF